MNKDEIRTIFHKYNILSNRRLYDIDFNKILEMIKNIDINILLEGIEIENSTIESIIDINKKTLIIMNSKFSHYLKLNNITYLTLEDNKSFLFKENYFKLFDEIYGVKNNYIKSKIEEIDLSDYDQILIYDDKKNYLYSKEEYNRIIVDVIRKLIHRFEGEIYYRTLYKNISEFRSLLLLKYLDKVVISFDKNNEESYLIFNNNPTDQVSIIKYLSTNNKDYKKIINNNRVNKEYLIKVKNSDIRNNNYRLGFGIYASVDSIDIKEILDSNEKLIRQLDHISEDINYELEKFFNKGELL